MLFRRIFNRIAAARGKWGVYLLEVALIVLSVLLAIQADRYNQERKNEAKLKAYIQALYQDLKDEQFANRNNLLDCKKDIASIASCIRLSQYDQNDSITMALDHFRQVFSRGVFRAFPPTTFHIMTNSGDIALIKDLALRKQLAATFAFRDNYIKQDLRNHDQLTKDIASRMSPYLDFPCMKRSDGLHQCLTDRHGFAANGQNDLFLFQQTAEARAFHLKVGINYFEACIGELEGLYGEVLAVEDAYSE